MRKKISTWLIGITFMMVTAFFVAFPNLGVAEVNNIFVEDNANILTQADKDYIKQINEKTFIELPGNPQYAVVTLKNLDDYGSIEDYAVHKFEKLKIGQKDLDNGFLFVISVEDRKYKLETGYGVEDVITDSMKDKVVTDEATELLQAEQYGQAVMVVSKNIERLVNEKYSDLDAARDYVAMEKARDQKIFKMIMSVFFGLIALVIGAFSLYGLGVKKVRKAITKEYLDKNMSGFIYQEKTNELSGKMQGVRKVNLSQHLAKTLYRLPSKGKVLSDSSEMKRWLGQYLLVDGIIEYWNKDKKNAPYDISIYLDNKHLKKLKDELLADAQDFNYPIESNPYLVGDSVGTIAQYVLVTSQKHKENLRISKQNKEYVERVSELYLEQNGARLRKIDHELQIALMVYYFLKDKDLSDPQLLKEIEIDNTSLNKAYRFAEKRRRQISSDQKRKALNDLTNMSLGNYYMQAMIWSSYHNSSNSGSGFGGGGGGSSFGGGSSGGGGFSGGW